MEIIIDIPIVIRPIIRAVLAMSFASASDASELINNAIAEIIISNLSNQPVVIIRLPLIDKICAIM